MEEIPDSSDVYLLGFPIIAEDDFRKIESMLLNESEMLGTLSTANGRAFIEHPYSAFYRDIVINYPDVEIVRLSGDSDAQEQKRYAYKLGIMAFIEYGMRAHEYFEEQEPEHAPVKYMGCEYPNPYGTFDSNKVEQILFKERSAPEGEDFPNAQVYLSWHPYMDSLINAISRNISSTEEQLSSLQAYALLGLHFMPEILSRYETLKNGINA